MTESNTWSSPEPRSSGRKNDKSKHKAQVQVGFSHFFFLLLLLLLCFLRKGFSV